MIRQTGGTNLDLTGPDGQTYEYLDRFKVEVWLIRKSGKAIRGAWAVVSKGSF